MLTGELNVALGPLLIAKARLLHAKSVWLVHPPETGWWANHVADAMPTPRIRLCSVHQFLAGPDYLTSSDGSWAYRCDTEETEEATNLPKFAETRTPRAKVQGRGTDTKRY